MATKGNDDFMEQLEAADEKAVEAVKPGTSRSPSTWLVIEEKTRDQAVYEGRTEQDILDQLAEAEKPGTFYIWPLRNSVGDPTRVTLKEQTTLVVEKS